MAVPPQPSATGSAPSGMVVFYLLIVIVSWGTNYPLMKLALQDISPLTFTAIRVLGGAGVVAAILLVMRAPQLLPSREELLPLAGVSLLQYGSVLGLTAIALLWLPAGRTIAAIYTMPLWAVIFDMLLMKLRPRWFQVLGMLTSLAGMLLFMDPGVLDWTDRGSVIGISLTLTAAMLWGLGAVLYRSRRWAASVWSQSFWQLLFTGILFAIVALLFEDPGTTRYTTTLLLVLVWNWVVPTAIGVWAWSRALHHVSASVAGQWLMCTPFVGIALSAWIFQEDLPPVFAVSAALIALGGVMVLLRRGGPYKSQ